MANPDLAAYMPAYRAPIPQPVVDCLEQNPMGCPWADYRRYFDEQVFDNRECFWPDVCQENARWARLAPRKARRPEQINEPLGGDGLISSLTSLTWMQELHPRPTNRNQRVIGTRPRDHDREIIFRCIYNLTNSNGTQPFPSLATGLTSLNRAMFEAFARLVRRVSSSTLCSEGPSRQFSQSADAWTSFYGWWPKRRYFSSSKMRIPAK